MGTEGERAPNCPDITHYRPDPPPSKSNPQGVLCDCFGPKSPLWHAVRYAEEGQSIETSIPQPNGSYEGLSVFKRIDPNTKCDNKFQDDLKQHFVSWQHTMKKSLKEFQEKK